MLWAVGAPARSSCRSSVGCGGGASSPRAFRVTESTAERFALFTIIVLGEVIVGVVDGLTEAGGGWATKGVGWLCLGIGFGIWWNYFDFVGRRPPRPGLGIRGVWLVAHLPLSMSVAAIGAGMVSLIEHATDDRTPTGTSWLVGGSMALLCVSLAVVVSLMPERPGARLVPFSLATAALLALVAAALHPRPWLLAAALLVLLTLVWVEAFVRHARLGEPFVGTTRSADSLRRVYRAGESSPVISADLDVRLREWRHHLHQHPETGVRRARRPATIVADVLTGLGLEVARGVGGTGRRRLAARGRRSARSGLRADMDALPLSERGRRAYASTTDGRDARLRSRRAHGDGARRGGGPGRRTGFDGTVRVVFQPAEEPGRGAQAMLDDGLLDRFPMDALYGLHNLPGCRPDTCTPAPARSWPARTTSRSGSPGEAATRPARRWSSTRWSSAPRSCWPCRRSWRATSTRASRPSCPAPRFATDGARNAIPGEVVIRGDTRSFTPAVQALHRGAASAPVRRASAPPTERPAPSTYTHEFAPTINDPRLRSGRSARAATAAVGVDAVDANCAPIMASEDFGVFARRVPGLLRVHRQRDRARPRRDAAAQPGLRLQRRRPRGRGRGTTSSWCGRSCPKAHPSDLG